MNTLTITVTDNTWSTYEIELNSCNTESEIIDFINEEKEGEVEEGEEIEPAASFTITDWQEVPGCFQTLEAAKELIEEYENSSYSLEVFEAAQEAGIQLSDIDDAYSGEHSSDRDFAMDMAEQLGEYDFKNESWPKKCIDWEYAAKELMYDYCSANGYYFRNI